MEPVFTLSGATSKEARHELFLGRFAQYIAGETNGISVMANTAAALREAFGFFWVGFYIAADEQWLSLGPFQGTAACWRIRKGHGVCGTAWALGEALLVEDVSKFQGHIACSALSKSEIVIPLFDTTHKVRAVLDIDSDKPAYFDATDLGFLQRLCALVSAQIYP